MFVISCWVWYDSFDLIESQRYSQMIVDAMKQFNWKHHNLATTKAKTYHNQSYDHDCERQCTLFDCQFNKLMTMLVVKFHSHKNILYL